MFCTIFVTAPCYFVYSFIMDGVARSNAQAQPGDHKSRPFPGGLVLGVFHASHLMDAWSVCAGTALKIPVGGGGWNITRDTGGGLEQHSRYRGGLEQHSRYRGGMPHGGDET